MLFTKVSLLECSTGVFDISPILNDGAAAIVDDSFLRSFKSVMDEPWNWNFYLFPLWCIGVVVRNLILYPLRWVGSGCFRSVPALFVMHDYGHYLTVFCDAV